MKVRTIEILYETPFRREGDTSPVLASVTIAKGQIWALGLRYALTDEEKQAVLDHHHATQLREWAEFLESEQ